VVLAALGLALSAAMIASCGGSAGGPSPSSSPSPRFTAIVPTASPLPVVVGRVRGADAAIRAYWAALATGDQTQLAGLVTQSHLDTLLVAVRDVKHAKVERILPAVGGPPAGATCQVPVDVYIEPAGSSTPWGAPAVHRVWMTLLGFQDGTWLVAATGTSP
jgi:hypothetical protein